MERVLSIVREALPAWWGIIFAVQTFFKIYELSAVKQFLNIMWVTIFLEVLHWWPYATLAILVCVCVRSWSAWPYVELWPNSALRTVVDGPPCQTLSLSYHSGPHTFKWTRFCYHKLSKKQNRGIMWWNMLKIAHAINTVHAEMCDADCFPHFVTADELRSGLFS